MTYKPGTSWAICDSCGFKFYLSELRKDWRGFMVCEDDFEPRHPQDTIQVKKERIVVPNARVQQPDVFLEPGDVTVEDL